MDMREIENEALHLPKNEREILLQKLVLSLDTPSSKELREDWLAEAALRADELDKGVVGAVSGEEVLRKARALIR